MVSRRIVILQIIIRKSSIMKTLRLLFIFLSVPLFAQQGGMWIPSLLEGMNESEMTNLGMKMTAKDIYDVNNASLKDAVPHFNGGCTSEVISNQGLLLTNHHCGYSQIQSHSSLENDYLEDGFWAMNLKEELPNPGVTATFIVKIEDVTTKIMDGITAAMSEAEKQKRLNKTLRMSRRLHQKKLIRKTAYVLFMKAINICFLWWKPIKIFV